MNKYSSNYSSNSRKTARIIDFSDAITKVNGFAVYLKPGTTATNAAVGLEIKVGSSSAQSVSDSGVGFKNMDTFNFHFFRKKQKKI